MTWARAEGPEDVINCLRRNEIKKCGDHKCDYRCLSKNFLYSYGFDNYTVVYIRVEQCDTDEWFV